MAILPKCATVTERWPTSAGAMGCSRVFTQRRKSWRCPWRLSPGGFGRGTSSGPMTVCRNWGGSVLRLVLVTCIHVTHGDDLAILLLKKTLYVPHSHAAQPDDSPREAVTGSRSAPATQDRAGHKIGHGPGGTGRLEKASSRNGMESACHGCFPLSPDRFQGVDVQVLDIERSFFCK